MKKMPKLPVGSDTRSHRVTGMITHTGGRSDAPDFHWLMIDAWCRCRPDVVLADAGYDSGEIKGRESFFCVASQRVH